MSDEPDGELHVVEMLRSLQAAGIEFLVFGAVAVGLHGWVRATADLDIVLEPSNENLDRATRWLIQQDARLGSDPQKKFLTVSHRAFKRGGNVTAVTSLGPIDMVQHLSNLPAYPELAARALEVPFDDMTLRVVDRATIIASKRARATATDLDDVAKLEALDGP